MSEFKKNPNRYWIAFHFINTVMAAGGIGYFWYTVFWQSIWVVIIVSVLCFVVLALKAYAYSQKD